MLFQELESLLPQRPQVIVPKGDLVEEVDMHDYDPSERGGRGGSSGRSEAYASDDEDHHGPGIQCAQQ